VAPRSVRRSLSLRRPPLRRLAAHAASIGRRLPGALPFTKQSRRIKGAQSVDQHRAQNPEIFYIQSVQALNARFARGHEMHIIVNRLTTHSLFPCVELGRNHILHAHLYKPRAWQNAFSDHFCCDPSVNSKSQSAARQSSEETQGTGNASSCRSVDAVFKRIL